jgi:hypothetical protein
MVKPRYRAGIFHCFVTNVSAMAVKITSYSISELAAINNKVMMDLSIS